MTVSITQYSICVVQSLYYFLNRTSYTRHGATKTLKSRYSDLDIILGFPHTLNEINLPTLALIQDPSLEEPDTFGSHRMERIMPFHIDGFAGGSQVEARNQLLRDQIRDDLRYFLADTDYVDLYDVTSNGKIDTSSTISDIEIVNVRDENLPVTGPLAVDRYRFRVSFDVSLTRDA